MNIWSEQQHELWEKPAEGKKYQKIELKEWV